MLCLVGAVVGFGCREASDVVVYCSVDEEFSRQILDTFSQRTGLRVSHVIDGEAGKTTGLINRIRAERGRPRADVLFSSELFGTMELADEGLLAAFTPSTARDIGRSFRDKEHHWTAIGLRGRVLAFDPSRVSREELPDRWEQLRDPKWAGRLAMANPLFGTTRGHVAAMFAVWGDDRARAFLTKLRAGGALIVDSNSASVRAVLDGRAAIGMTDTDDVWVAQRAGRRVDLIYPDMGDGGTLWIPCSVAVIEGAPHQANAQRLVDYLVSEEVERMLAKSASRNVPVRAGLRDSLGLEFGGRSRCTFEEIAAKIKTSGEAVREILLR